MACVSNSQIDGPTQHGHPVSGRALEIICSGLNTSKHGKTEQERWLLTRHYRGIELEAWSTTIGEMYCLYYIGTNLSLASVTVQYQVTTRHRRSPRFPFQTMYVQNLHIIPTRPPSGTFQLFHSTVDVDTRHLQLRSNYRLLFRRYLRVTLVHLEHPSRLKYSFVSSAASSASTAQACTTHL